MIYSEFEIEMEFLESLSVYEKLYESNVTFKNSVSENNTFCKGPFWNSTLTWHTDDPDITECFRDTILVGVPSAFLWVIGLPLWAWKLMRDTSKPNHNKTYISNRPRLKGNSHCFVS